MYFKRILFFPLCFVTVTHAIIGGIEADSLHGQVQIWHRPQFVPPGMHTYVCSGTLISPEWVLTAKHCVENFATEYIIMANLNFGEGDLHFGMDVARHPSEDLAAIQLENAVTNGPVIGYSLSNIPIPNCGLVNISGWGPTLNHFGPDPRRLMVATMFYLGVADLTNDLGLGNAGLGYPAPGDSGAGVVFGGTAYGTLKNGNNVNAAFAVPFSKIGNWIHHTTGVQPVQLNSRALAIDSRQDKLDHCGICPGFNYGIADLGPDTESGNEGYSVLDSACRQVAGTVTPNPCNDPLFSCSPPPIKIVGLHIDGSNYACREDPRAGSCRGSAIQFCCRNDGN